MIAVDAIREYMASEEVRVNGWTPEGVLDVIGYVPMEAFVREVAKLTKDGEDDGDGGEFVMENDDAYDSLHGLISEARAILGLSHRNDPAE